MVPIEGSERSCRTPSRPDRFTEATNLIEQFASSNPERPLFESFLGPDPVKKRTMGVQPPRLRTRRLHVPPGITKFGSWIAEHHVHFGGNGNRAYRFEIRPVGMGGPELGDWVSIVALEAGDEEIEYADTIVVYYQAEQINEHVGVVSPESRATSPDLFFRPTESRTYVDIARWVRTKIVLHEIAHMTWHMDSIFAEGETTSGISSRDDEEEAWKYSLFWWARIMGDYAYHCREDETDARLPTDPTWRIV